MSLAPGTLLGRYEIRSKLGEGGMGEVYLAQDTGELGRAVALKLLSAEVASDPGRMSRFMQEARTVSALNHPNILTVYDFGEAGGTRFIVTEYVDGVTLREYAATRRLKLHDVLEVAAQVAAALDAAHEAGVVHRDIKPENVMIRRRDHIVKVLDFGLAKLAERPAPAGPQAVDTKAGTRLRVNTEPGTVMGTVAYMSPEQTRGEAADARTDVWSLGVVLYELVAGRPPFEGKDVHRQVIAIQDEEPPPLSRSAEGVPERLEETVSKALAKDPEERYQTAKDLLIDLRNLKRKLDVDAEIERTVLPELKGAAGGAGGARATVSGAQQSAAQTASVGRTQPTSSAEYLVGQIRRHKRGALLVALALVAAASLALYFYPAKRGGGVEAIDSVAVLPLVNESRDPDVDWLADGLTESIIYRLSQLPGLKVLARSTVFRYKGRDVDAARAARELQVRAVLTGRVMQRGDALTVSAELIDARDDRLLWGERYERKMTDLNAVQQEIARAVSEKLREKLTGEEQKQLAKGNTENTEAYQLYLKGRYYWNRRAPEEIQRAIEYFNRAIETDPTYALAYSGLADCYNLQGLRETDPRDSFPKAKATALKALEIDDTLAEAHSSLGFIKHRFDWDFAGAEKEFKRALELNPNYGTAHQWYAFYLGSVGKFAEAIEEMKRAQELDPLSLEINADLGLMFTYPHQYDQSIAQLQKTLALDPNFSYAHYLLGRAYRLKGMFPEAIAELNQARLIAPEIPYYLSTLCHIYAAAGRRSEAQHLLDELQETSKHKYVSPSSFAMAYAGFGDKEKALEFLNKCYEERVPGLALLKADPLWDGLRPDPRFQDLLRRVGLSP